MKIKFRKTQKLGKSVCEPNWENEVALARVLSVVLCGGFDWGAGEIPRCDAGETRFLLHRAGSNFKGNAFRNRRN